jgi:hypothetical protein
MVRAGRWNFVSAMGAITLLASALTLPGCNQPPRLDEALRCHLGAYDLEGGGSIAIVASGDATDSFRFVLDDGQRGILKKSADGSFVAGNDKPFAWVRFGTCESGTISYLVSGAESIEGRRHLLVISETKFHSGSVELHGKLVLPASGLADQVLVWVQGSGSDAETDKIPWQFILPLRGIGVFVYDKRGTGLSGGRQTANFDLRASDTTAAGEDVRRLLQGHSFKLGVFGGSQGGWIAPLAAHRAPFDFVIVGYGLAEGVTSQDRDTVADSLRRAGYGDDVLAKARQVTEATALIAMSRWRTGWDELARLKKKFANEPWPKHFGNLGYTGTLWSWPFPATTGPIVGPTLGSLLDQGVSFDYDPQPVLKSIDAPHLWILAGADRTAPSANTIAIIKEIQKSRPNLSLVVYKNADHGIIESYSDHGLERRRYPVGYFDLVANWIQSGELPAAREGLDVFARP